MIAWRGRWSKMIWGPLPPVHKIFLRKIKFNKDLTEMTFGSEQFNISVKGSRWDSEIMQPSYLHKKLFVTWGKYDPLKYKSASNCFQPCYIWFPSWHGLGDSSESKWPLIWSHWSNKLVWFLWLYSLPTVNHFVEVVVPSNLQDESDERVKWKKALCLVMKG